MQHIVGSRPGRCRRAGFGNSSAAAGTTSSVKLRGDSTEAPAALSRQGRYRSVAANLRVRELIIDEGTMRRRFGDQPQYSHGLRQALSAFLCASSGTWIEERTVRAGTVTAG